MDLKGILVRQGIVVPINQSEPTPPCNILVSTPSHQQSHKATPSSFLFLLSLLSQHIHSTSISIPNLEKTKMNKAQLTN